MQLAFGVGVWRRAGALDVEAGAEDCAGDGAAEIVPEVDTVVRLPADPEEPLGASASPSPSAERFALSGVPEPVPPLRWEGVAPWEPPALFGALSLSGLSGKDVESCSNGRKGSSVATSATTSPASMTPKVRAITVILPLVRRA